MTSTHDAKTEFQIIAMRERLSALRSAARDVPAPESGLLQDAFYEIYQGLEDLEIAHEELAAQTEQLAETYGVIEMERRQYTRLLNTLQDGVLFTDESSKIFEANASAASLLNASLKTLTGKSFMSFISRDMRWHSQSRVAELCKQRGILSWNSNITPAGTALEFPAAVTAHIGADLSAGILWIVRPIFSATV